MTYLHMLSLQVRSLSQCYKAFTSCSQALKPLLNLYIITMLIRTLDDPDPHAREASLCALANLSAHGDADVAERVSHRAVDPEPYVRRAAHLCLGEVGVGCQKAISALSQYALGSVGDGSDEVSLKFRRRRTHECMYCLVGWGLIVRGLRGCDPLLRAILLTQCLMCFRCELQRLRVLPSSCEDM